MKGNNELAEQLQEDVTLIAAKIKVCAAEACTRLTC